MKAGTVSCWVIAIMLCCCTDALRVLHLTDLHFDPLYVAGAPSYCKHKHQTFCCCRNNSVPVNISDPRPARLFGEYDCDSPRALIDSMLAFCNSSGPIDLILWTGDNQPHDSYDITERQTLDDIKFVTNMIAAAFPSTPLYPSLGNHDYWMASQFKPPPASNWLLHNISQVWAPFLSQEAQSTLRKFGGYVESIGHKLKIMSLNTLIYDTDNLNAYVADDDPMGQFAWAESELSKALQERCVVWIIGHLSPGGWTNQPQSITLHKFAKFYMHILETYGSVIKLNLFGHTHFNEFRLVSHADKGTQPLDVLYLSPAATPWLKQNPSVRFFDMDDITFGVSDYMQYYSDIAHQTTHLQWQLLYSAKSFYQLPNLSAESWLQLLARMETNATLFEAYFQNWKSKCPKTQCVLGQECAKRMICAQKYLLLPHIFECQAD